MLLAKLWAAKKTPNNVQLRKTTTILNKFCRLIFVNRFTKIVFSSLDIILNKELRNLTKILTQRRRDAKTQSFLINWFLNFYFLLDSLCAFATLHLCVKKPILFQEKLLNIWLFLYDVCYERKN